MGLALDLCRGYENNKNALIQGFYEGQIFVYGLGTKFFSPEKQNILHSGRVMDFIDCNRY